MTEHAAAPPDFESLEADIMARFGEADYDGALALLDAHASRFEANRANAEYLRACLEMRRGDERAAIAALRMAFDAGHWYSEPVLRESPSLLPLQGRPEYEALVAAFAERPPSEAAATEPAIARPGPPPRGLLVAFHGNGQTARHAAEAWRPMRDAGWIIAAPVSSQMLHSAGAVWDDPQTARDDIRRQAAAIGDLANADMPIVIAGFSLGADVALWAVLAGVIETRRALLIGPPAFIQDDPAWSELLGAAGGLQVHIMLGTQDAAVSARAIETMMERLRNAGAFVRLDRLDGLAHAYPPIEVRRPIVEALADAGS